MSIPLALRVMLIYNRKKGGDVVMTEPMKMNIFDSVDNNHEASEDLPVISKRCFRSGYARLYGISIITADDMCSCF